MPEKESNSQSDFMIEKIKERPINKKKLIRRTVITASMAVIFGLVACFTFLALEPILNNVMNPKEQAPRIYFPEETNEMNPEEMLSDNLPTDENSREDGEGDTEHSLENEQIGDVLAGVELDLIYYRQLYSAMAEYAANLKRSMVTLTGISSKIDWFNNVNESQNKSSGLVIGITKNQVYILTDFTPLEKAEKINVVFNGGAVGEGQLIRKDPTTNLAAVSVSLEGLSEEDLEKFNEKVKVPTKGSSNYGTLVGSPVIALGSPMGTMDSVGYGLITSDSGRVSEKDISYKLLQTDIVGYSKATGVLFNLEGQLVGVITNSHPVDGMENLIVAYGITDLTKRMEKLIGNQPFAYAGIYGETVSREVNEMQGVPSGAYVSDVIMDSPAMRAGIRQGDVITKLEDRMIINFRDYVSAMAQQKPDKTVTVTVMRQAQNGYKEMVLEMTLGELKEK